MKRALIVIVLLLAAGGAVWYFFFNKETQPVVLSTEEPKYGYISKSVTATGTIEPVDTVNVGCQVSGTINGIYTDYNAKVKKHQLIASLDKSLFEATVNQYKANLQLAKSTLVYAQNNFERESTLYKAGAISKADYDNYENQYLGAKATVGSVQAQLDAAQKNLDYANIYSPVDGFVMTRNVSVGQTVAASFNTPTLFMIAKDITKMQVQAAVSEADIGDVRPGLRATFTVDAYPDISFTGTVSQIRLEPVVSANVVTYTTIISAPNQDLKLRPGMTANIFIFTKEVDSALLVSAKALKFKPDPTMEKQFRIIPDSIGEREVQRAARRETNNPLAPPRHHPDTTGRQVDTASTEGTPAFVWVQVGDSLVERLVTTGLNNDTQVQILSGLITGDVVVNGTGIVTKGTKPGATARSPFMPTRRPSGSSRGNTRGGAAGGAGGGAGGRGNGGR
ncbi:MAG TPA: efflux RND transporter periplasmic adaptor subunit [Puia sp.]|nr:efflux RND transporter periplasmic adaptor subunit [Puia sp.]